MDDVLRQEAHYLQGGYILGMDSRYFYNICIREPRVLTDHQMILAELKGYGLRINCKYFRGRTTWLIVAPKWGPIHEEDAIFNDLQKEVKKPMRKAQDNSTWISEETWRFEYHRTALRRIHAAGQ